MHSLVYNPGNSRKVCNGIMRMNEADKCGACGLGSATHHAAFVSQRQLLSCGVHDDVVEKGKRVVALFSLAKPASTVVPY